MSQSVLLNLISLYWMDKHGSASNICFTSHVHSLSIIKGRYFSIIRPAVLIYGDCTAQCDKSKIVLIMLYDIARYVVYLHTIINNLEISTFTGTRQGLNLVWFLEIKLTEEKNELSQI